MNQSLHILCKDVEHLRSELSIYAGLLIGAAIAIPRSWNFSGAPNEPLDIFVGLLNYVIPILWVFLIARVMHDEALVGDTQFWITRPYRWTSLLGAKLLFILLCLLVPFTLLQWVVVLQAGLNPLHAIAGQLFGLLRMLILWAILINIASVTATIQAVITSTLVSLLVWAGILTTLGSITGDRMSLPFAAETFTLIVGLLVAILVYQYATRNTSASRLALVATAALFVLLYAYLINGLIQPPVNLFVRHHYPISTKGPLSLAFDPTSIPSEDAGVGQHLLGKNLIVHIPITLQGVDATTQLDHQNVSFTIDAPGYHYTSPWRPANLEGTTLLLLIPQEALDSTHGDNVHLHLSAIAQRLLPGTPQPVTVADTFTIPENGICHLTPTLSGDNVGCRWAFRLASRTVIHAAITSASCLTPGPTHPAMETLAARTPMNGPDPTVGLILHLGGSVCPGTQLIFTPYYPANNLRLELDIPSVNLNRYLVR